MFVTNSAAKFSGTASDSILHFPSFESVKKSLLLILCGQQIDLIMSMGQRYCDVKIDVTPLVLTVM